MVELLIVCSGLTLRTPPGGELEDGLETLLGKVETGGMVPLRTVVTSQQVLGARLLTVAVELPLQSLHQTSPTESNTRRVSRIRLRSYTSGRAPLSTTNSLFSLP